MNELIKVKMNENQEQIVSGRELHQFLEVKEKYTEWFKRMKEYGFSDKQDYDEYIEKVQSEKRERTYEQVDHVLKLDMAKELSMIQRTERGKQARLYFIEVEKAWNSPEQIMARALQLASNQIDNYKKQIEEQKPLVSFAETCIASKDSVLVRDVAKIASKKGVNIGEKRLYRKLREWKMIMKESTEPYQAYIDRGYFEVVQGGKETSYGNILYKTTKVTPKGQVYIIEKLKDELAVTLQKVN